ncbi:Adagio protein 2 [Psilocybe cubensis]|uniref:Adagio protein 2 n=2 Tax=Psilocybe cubensis TaxID=181762 RepID=A0ACB8H0I4_PSICU|nr:Adagio protein 2 [Psilocybe cubensis]KAH9481303.1 Adagio protein 2 [Psilocybe cubensis]
MHSYILTNLRFLLLLQFTVSQVWGFNASARWGQAAVVINDALYIFGGKTDNYNSFSYTSAPNNNDLLYLSLSSPFDASAPPWDLVSSSTNLSTSQGPALAWSTLSALNTSTILLFGGQPGPNSPIVITDAADSADLLDVFSRLSPNWIIEPAFWLNEPIRRIRHSTVTAPSGLVFIFGGEKADGSRNGFSDHYVFDPNALNFTLLPLDNAPPDIYGHTSIILPDGRILVFGGFCQSLGKLLPFSTIWILDTKQANLTWSVVELVQTDVPSPRMAFVAVLISGGKIIIQGGSDANLQNNFSDGWVLDTTQSPMTWTPVDALSQLGPRRDHFGVSSGEQVIFGFGYTNNGPAPAPLQIYNPSSNSFTPTYTPPPDNSVTQTLPIPSQTTKSTSHTTAGSTTNGVHPTSTSDPNNPAGGGNGEPNDDTGTNRTTAVAVGTVFAVIGVLLIGIGFAYYVRRKHRQRDDRQFLALGGDDDDESDSPHLSGPIPVVGMHREMGEVRGARGLLGSLGIASALSAATKMRSMRNQPPRRDMLADEDTRSFGEWYNARKREGRGGSSWSLLNMFGGGTPRLRSRQASSTGRSVRSTPWVEKHDPFSDGATSMKDEETGFIGAAALDHRPHTRRESSYASYASSRSGPYRDPFADTIQEEARPEYAPTDLDEQYSDSIHDHLEPTVRHVVPPTLPAIRTVLPLSQQINQTLSPLSERTSQSSFLHASGSSQAHSSENVPSPFSGGFMSQATSMTSIHPTTPSSPKTTSIIGASDPSLLQTNQPMRRSDSWWSRFSRSSFLERRSSNAGARASYDIRDPNPAPRLGAIEEGSLHTDSRSSPGSADQKALEAAAAAAVAVVAQKEKEKSGSGSQRESGGPHVYGAEGHGKSMSSLRTADSEAIERMAGTMDVVQRVKERSKRGSGSTSSTGGLSFDTQGTVSEIGEDMHMRMVMSPDSDPTGLAGAGPSTSNAIATSPPSAYKDTFGPIGPLHIDGGSTPLSPSKVSERVQAYERRMSQDQPTSPLPKNSKQREERPKKRVEVDYGLVPRPSLFVANPDHRLESS